MRYLLLIIASLVSSPALADPLMDEIKRSDDFAKYGKIQTEALMRLIDNGTCKAEDIISVGAWYRSTSKKPAPIFFTYCGGMTVKNRYYLDARTGQVYQ
ncbi:hypothetical protein [Shinella oryzae]|uniref:hypothetical protein n=1 Tax=Shinella oryzae TaxID=2871820 RepID=UPI001FF6DD45|nr:hypothetical protein [Shinella oryzae]UPA25352.1 hypothetical protein K6301_03880 [Shinella oryzae]